MKKLAFFFILCFCLTFHSKSTNYKDSDNEIKHLFALFKDFMENEEMSLMPKIFSQDDLLVIATDNIRYNGYQSFKDAVNEIFIVYEDGKTKISEPENVSIYIHSSEDVAWFAYEFNWDFVIENNPYSMPVRFSGLTIKKSSGWRILKLHASIPSEY